MKNFFSSSETVPEVDPAFSNQPQSGGSPIAPACNPKLPAPASTELRVGEALAERTAPGSAHKSDPITGR